MTSDARMPEPVSPIERVITWPQAELDKGEIVWGLGDIDLGFQNMGMEINRLRAELTTARADWFKRGQESVQRKNESGCACKIDDDDKVISACAAHVAWRDSVRAEGRRGGMTEAAKICRDDGISLDNSYNRKNHDVGELQAPYFECAEAIESARDAK